MCLFSKKSNPGQRDYKPKWPSKKKIRKAQNTGSDVSHLRGPTTGGVSQGGANEKTVGKAQERRWLAIVEIMFPLHKPVNSSSSALL